MHRDLFQYDPVLGHRFVPGIRARVHHSGGGYLLETNASGFRCRHDFTAAKKRGTTRILLFGDSYTAGEGVSDRHRYGNLLEELLPRTQVLNLAIPGTGTDQQYLAWREVGKEVRHDIVVIAVLVENIRRIAVRYRPYLTRDGATVMLAKPYFSLAPDGSLELHHVPVPREPMPAAAMPPSERHQVDQGGALAGPRRLVNRFGGRVKEPLQRITRFQPVPAYGRPDSPDWQLMKAILTKWTDEISVPVIIMPIPLYQHVEGTASASDYQARFRELASLPGVRVHDPLPDLMVYPQMVRRTFRFEDDCHLTPAAHDAVARSLARALAPHTKAPDH